MTFDPGYALQILPTILGAARVTIIATAGGMALAMILGLIIALARMSHLLAIRWFAAFIFHFVRGTPLLIQLFFLFYVLPFYGIVLPALLTGIFALGLHVGAYLSEVYRAGIQAVPVGQWDAATALNLSRGTTWRSIVLPQAIRPMIPAMGSYLILMFKESALLSTITVPELLSTALDQAHQTYRFLEPLALVGVIFFAFSYPASIAVRRLERRYAPQ